MSTFFEDLKDTEYEGVKELADAAEGVLRSTGTSQEKGTVAEYPNERTVRYYLAEGLLPQPIEKRGLTSIFGYEHLLTLLAIKKLQSEGLPINVIKTLIAGKPTAELETILGDQIGSTMTPNHDIFTNVAEETAVRAESLDDVMFSALDLGIAEPKKNAAKKYLESLLLGHHRQQEVKPPKAALAPSPMVAERPQVPVTWQRHEIEPGLEVHIRDDYKSPTDYPEMKRLLETIKKYLQR